MQTSSQVGGAAASRARRGAEEVGRPTRRDEEGWPVARPSVSRKEGYAARSERGARVRGSGVGRGLPSGQRGRNRAGSFSSRGCAWGRSRHGSPHRVVSAWTRLTSGRAVFRSGQNQRAASWPEKPGSNAQVYLGHGMDPTADSPMNSPALQRRRCVFHCWIPGPP